MRVALFEPEIAGNVGAVLRLGACPAEGKGAALVMPRCNTEGMTPHLAEISAAVAPGAHAVLLLLDQPWRIMSLGRRPWEHE